MSSIIAMVSGKIYMTLALSGWVSTILNGLGDILKGIFDTLIYAALAAITWAFYPVVYAIYAIVYEILMPALWGMCRLISGEFLSSMYADALMVKDEGTFSTALKSLFSLTGDISNVIIVYGVVFTIVFFMMDIFDRSTRSDLDMMTLAKQTIIMIFTASLICITPQVATTVVTVTGEITKDVFDEVENIKGADLNTVQIDSNGEVTYDKNSGDNTIAAKLLNGMVGMREGYSLIKENGTDYVLAAEATAIYAEAEADHIEEAWASSDTGVGAKVKDTLQGVLNITLQPIGMALKIAMAVFVLLIPFVVILGISVFCLSVFITRGIQLAVYAVFMPIAIVDMYHNGIMSSGGMKYIKKFAAIGLQGIVLYMCLVLSQAFLSTAGAAVYSNNSVTGAADILAAGGNGLLFIVIAVATSFASLSLALKSQQIANDFIG